MLIQALNESKEVYLFRMRYLHQLVFVIMGEEVVLQFLRSCNISLQIACEHFVKVVFMGQTAH
mgnify:CR=1 FL=1